MSLDDFDVFARWREPAAIVTVERAPGRVANTERLASRPGVMVVRDMLTAAGGSLVEVEQHAAALREFIDERLCALAAERASQLRHALRYAEHQLEVALFRAEVEAPHLYETIVGYYGRVQTGATEIQSLLDDAPTAAEEAHPTAWRARLDAADGDLDLVSEDDEPMGELIDATELFRPTARARAPRMNGDR